MYGQHFQQSMDQPGTTANPAYGQLKRNNEIFHLSPFAPETEFGLARRVRPSRPENVLIKEEVAKPRFELDPKWKTAEFVSRKKRAIRAQA